MQVQVQAYRVEVGSGNVGIEFAVILPTGNVTQTITATDATLKEIALADGRDTWDERDIVSLLSGTFKALGDTVTA